MMDDDQRFQSYTGKGLIIPGWQNDWTQGAGHILPVWLSTIASPPHPVHMGQVR
jgi:hypothetical protein